MNQKSAFTATIYIWGFTSLAILEYFVRAFSGKCTWWNFFYISASALVLYGLSIKFLSRLTKKEDNANLLTKFNLDNRSKNLILILVTVTLALTYFFLERGASLIDLIGAGCMAGQVIGYIYLKIFKKDHPEENTD